MHVWKSTMQSVFVLYVRKVSGLINYINKLLLGMIGFIWAAVTNMLYNLVVGTIPTSLGRAV